MGYADPDRQREYQREWIKKRRLDYLTDKCCAKCGGTESLEIDHIDPATKDPRLRQTMTSLWSWRLEARLVELTKCQVLCERCHMDKTLEQRPKTDHGRAQMYQAYRCRCEQCVTWKRDSDKKYRKSRNGARVA